MKGMVLAFLICLLGMGTSALADTYSCGDPPDKLAKVGVSSSSSVSMTQDKSAKECRISVNGVTVGSPPQNQVLQAVNQFRNRGIALQEIESRGIDNYLNSLALILMAAAPVSQVPEAVNR